MDERLQLSNSNSASSLPTPPTFHDTPAMVHHVEASVEAMAVPSAEVSLPPAREPSPVPTPAPTPASVAVEVEHVEVPRVAVDAPSVAYTPSAPLVAPVAPVNGHEASAQATSAAYITPAPLPLVNGSSAHTDVAQSVPVVEPAVDAPLAGPSAIPPPPALPLPSLDEISHPSIVRTDSTIVAPPTPAVLPVYTPPLPAPTPVSVPAFVPAPAPAPVASYPEDVKMGESVKEEDSTSAFGEQYGQKRAAPFEEGVVAQGDDARDVKRARVEEVSRSATLGSTPSEH